MRSAARLALAVLALLAVPALAAAGEPPNQNDPCGSAGRDTCGTTGVGFYRDYRFGVRWFGDFRRALPGYPQAFCIDLRYWYPSPAYRYREDTTGTLRNRDGRVVPLVNRQKMAYAMWADGRTRTPDQQAAVMLYVHGLMGDGAPGEVDGDAIGPAVAARYRRVASDAERLHGPYRIEVRLPPGLAVARKATGTVRVLSAAGVPLPGLRLQTAAPGVTGLPAEVRTDGGGVARIAFTPASAAGLKLTVRTEPVASTLPRVFTPSVPAAARNGQRLAVPAGQVVTEVVSRPVAQGRIAVTTKATPDKLAAGEASRDEVTIAGVAPGWRADVTVRLHGPYRSQAELRCDGEPAFQATVAASGPGTLTTPPATLTRPGWYTYQIVIPGSEDYAAVTTPCAVPAESLKVEAAPQVRTVISADVVQPGTAVTDLVTVSGLSGESVTVRAVLFGPFPSRDKIACTGAPVWTGTIPVAADGEYRTEPVPLTVPGYYTYQESIDASDLVRGVQTPCADAAETTVVVGKPQVVTQVSAQETRPGAKVTDRVVVSGLGVLSVPVQVELWGPFPSREAIACTGTPFWTGTFTADGDGTYTTEAVTLERAGYYTYRESIAGQPQNDAASTPCGEAAETTFVKAQPEVTTVVSDQVVRPGSSISDRIRVTGLGKTRAVISVELFGPFPTRAAIRCTGRPMWTGSVTAEGDGELRSATVTLPQAGFYTYRERLAGSPLVAATETACGEVAETSLGAPGVATGRGEAAPTPPPVRRPAADEAPAPTRVRVPGLGIDAPVTAVGIDVGKGILAVPADIRRAGWWRDGAAPGARSGAAVIAGHVDSARRGAGAFFRLKDARAGERVQVTTGDGRTRAYRITGIRVMPKRDLPTDIFAPGGPARLVLVTCGGPFDAAAGRYADNVVVTAVPA